MNDSKTAIRFLAFAMGLYIIWYVVYDLWLLGDGRFDDILSGNVAYVSGVVLSIIGFEGASNGFIVFLNGIPGVRVGAPCNGLVLYALFAGFVIAFPGPVKAKLFYIPLGIITIYLLNIIRVIALALNTYYSQDTLHFNHKYTYTFIVYAFIFGLWMLWAKKFAAPALTPNESASDSVVAS